MERNRKIRTQNITSCKSLCNKLPEIYKCIEGSKIQKKKREMEKHVQFQRSSIFLDNILSVIFIACTQCSGVHVFVIHYHGTASNIIQFIYHISSWQ